MVAIFSLDCKFLRENYLAHIKLLSVINNQRHKIFENERRINERRRYKWNEKENRHLAWSMQQKKYNLVGFFIHTWFERSLLLLLSSFFLFSSLFVISQDSFFAQFGFFFAVAQWLHNSWLFLKHIGSNAITADLLVFCHIHTHKWNIALEKMMMMTRQKCLIPIVIELERTKWARTWESEWHSQAIKWFHCRCYSFHSCLSFHLCCSLPFFPSLVFFPFVCIFRARESSNRILNMIRLLMPQKLFSWPQNNNVYINIETDIEIPIRSCYCPLLLRFAWTSHKKAHAFSSLPLALSQWHGSEHTHTQHKIA